MSIIPHEETWIPIPGYEAFYEINPSGIIRTLQRRKSICAGHIVRGSKDRNGYGMVYLTGEQKNVRKGHMRHILVAWAFLGEQPEGTEVGHIDQNNRNNHFSNLEYVTHKKNIQDSWEKTDRRFNVPRGEETGMSKLLPDQVLEIRQILSDGKYRSLRRVGQTYGVSHVAIIHIRDRKTWNHI